MSNRHLSRSIVLQSLFELDFRKKKESDIDTILERNALEFASGLQDMPFMRKLAHSILNKQRDIDAVIEKAAPEWPIEKISIIDRNVLRVGLFELIFADREEVPAKVAINEAIELAKEFGGENSGKFANGVLGAVYRELGEPGKDEVSKKKKNGPDTPYDKLPLERLGGAVVYAQDNVGNIHLALVHDVFGRWTLSKGKLKANEDESAGTKRKIKEEIGVDVDMGERLGENEYVANDPEAGRKRKRVSYFLAKTSFTKLALKKEGGLDDARWFLLSDIEGLNLYSDMKPIITRAIKLLADKDNLKIKGQKTK